VPATVSSLPGPAGLALVTPLTPASAPGVAGFRDGPARIGSEVALAAFPHGGRMGAPSTAIGTLGDIRSPGGDASGLQLDLRAPLGDTGGPVLDENGALIGMVAPRGENGVTPPDGVERGIATGTITASLDAAGIPWTPASAAAPLPREYLARAAADMTALVACWQ